MDTSYIRRKAKEFACIDTTTAPAGATHAYKGEVLLWNSSGEPPRWQYWNRLIDGVLYEWTGSCWVRWCKYSSLNVHQKQLLMEIE